MTSQRNKIDALIENVTIIKVGSQHIWFWVAIIKPKKGQILAQSLFQEKNMFVVEHFLSDIVRYYGKNPVSADGGIRYPQAYQFLKLTSYLFSFGEKPNRKDNTVYQR
jgi:transposase-like protein